MSRPHERHAGWPSPAPPEIQPPTTPGPDIPPPIREPEMPPTPQELPPLPPETPVPPAAGIAAAAMHRAPPLGR